MSTTQSLLCTRLSADTFELVTNLLFIPELYALWRCGDKLLHNKLRSGMKQVFFGETDQMTCCLPFLSEFVNLALLGIIHPTSVDMTPLGIKRAAQLAKFCSLLIERMSSQKLKTLAVTHANLAGLLFRTREQADLFPLLTFLHLGGNIKEVVLPNTLTELSLCWPSLIYSEECIEKLSHNLPPNLTSLQLHDAPITRLWWPTGAQHPIEWPPSLTRLVGSFGRTFQQWQPFISNLPRCILTLVFHNYHDPPTKRITETWSERMCIVSADIASLPQQLTDLDIRCSIDSSEMQQIYGMLPRGITKLFLAKSYGYDMPESDFSQLPPGIRDLKISSTTAFGTESTLKCEATLPRMLTSLSNGYNGDWHFSVESLQTLPEGLDRIVVYLPTVDRAVVASDAQPMRHLSSFRKLKSFMAINFDTPSLSFFDVLPKSVRSVEIDNLDNATIVFDLSLLARLHEGITILLLNSTVGRGVSNTDRSWSLLLPRNLRSFKMVRADPVLGREMSTPSSWADMPPLLTSLDMEIYNLTLEHVRILSLVCPRLEKIKIRTYMADGMVGRVDEVMSLLPITTCSLEIQEVSNPIQPRAKIGRVNLNKGGLPDLAFDAKTHLNRLRCLRFVKICRSNSPYIITAVLPSVTLRHVELCVSALKNQIWLERSAVAC